MKNTSAITYRSGDGRHSERHLSRYLTPFLALAAGLATLPGLSWVFRSHPQPRSVPSTRSVSSRRLTSFALLALLLVGVLLWSTPAEGDIAQTSPPPPIFGIG